MTQKAKEILRKLRNPRYRQALLEDLNQANLDEPARVGGDQEMKVLKEMNELQGLATDAGRKDPGRYAGAFSHLSRLQLAKE